MIFPLLPHQAASTVVQARDIAEANDILERFGLDVNALFGYLTRLRSSSILDEPQMRVLTEQFDASGTALLNVPYLYANVEKNTYYNLRAGLFFSTTAAGGSKLQLG